MQACNWGRMGKEIEKQKSVAYLPHKDLCVPTSLSKLAAPANLLTIQGEVFSNPEDGIRLSLKLCCTELSGNTTCASSKAKSALGPRISPHVSFVVIYLLPRERTLVVGVRVLAQTFFQRHFFQRHVKAPKTDFESDSGLDLLVDAYREHVGLVLRLDAGRVGVPLVAEVGHQYNGSHEQSYKKSQRRP